MIRRKPTRTRPPQAKAPKPVVRKQEPDDLLTALGKGWASTADLVRGLEAHRDSSMELLQALSKHEQDTKRLLRGLADVLGSFDRMLAYDDELGLDEYRESVRKTSQVLTDTLWDNGVELIGERGEIAEPDTHNVLQVRLAADLPNDSVLHVVQRGFRYGGRMVRPASVVVSTNDPDDDAIKDKQQQTEATEPDGDGRGEERS